MPARAAAAAHHIRNGDVACDQPRRPQVSTHLKAPVGLVPCCVFAAQSPKVTHSGCPHASLPMMHSSAWCFRPAAPMPKPTPAAAAAATAGPTATNVAPAAPAGPSSPNQADFFSLGG